MIVFLKNVLIARGSLVRASFARTAALNPDGGVTHGRDRKQIC